MENTSQLGPREVFFACNTEGYRVSAVILWLFSTHKHTTQQLLFYLSVVFFQANHYKILGCYAALSIIQGGPGLPFFHAHVYTYLCTGVWSPTKIGLAAIPNHDLQSIVENVSFILHMLRL